MNLRLRILGLVIVIGLFANAFADECAEQKAQGNQIAVSFQEKAEKIRQVYATHLVELLYQYPDKGPIWTPVLESSFTNICKMLIAVPMPENEDENKLRRLMCGFWQSPRHEYLYRSDGTWTMLPEPATSGKWKIQGNKLDDSSLILLNEKYCVYYDKSSPFVYRMKRLPRNPYDKDGKIISLPSKD